MLYFNLKTKTKIIRCKNAHFFNSSNVENCQADEFLETAFKCNHAGLPDGKECTKKLNAHFSHFAALLCHTLPCMVNS